MLTNKQLTSNIPYISEKKWRYFWLCARKYFTPAMQNFLAAPDHWLACSAKFFKNNPGDTSTVGLIELDGITLVVKRYNIKGFWHGVKLLFRPSRAMVSWRYAHRLRQLNIPTLEPIAVLEKRLGPFRRQAYFVSRFIVGEMGSKFFAGAGQIPEVCTTAINGIVRILGQLKSAKLRHNDFHHDNFLMVNNLPVLIDLDHMREYHYCMRCFQKAHQKDIAHFRHYLKDNKLALQIFEEMLARTN